MSEPRTATPTYRADIDGLRALAVLPVCFFHAGLSTFPGGFVGVSVFFVISGYLMATLIGQELERGEFSLANFYERRVRRIFPALFVVLFFCAVIAAVIVPPRLFRDFGATMVATVLFASNVLFWRKTANYFDAPTEWNPLLHTWSLAVEEQFYILFPLFLLLAWRYGWRARFGLTAAAALASLALSLWGTANTPTATFYLLPTRAWELLLGSLVALWAMRDQGAGQHREAPQWIATAGGLLGLALILGSLIGYHREMEFPGAAALLPTLGAALVIHFGRDASAPASRLLGLLPFTFIGKISYSLYLWHWPLIVFADKYRPFGALEAAHKAGVIAISCVIAYFCWRWVEQPFRGRRSPVGRAPLYGAAAASMVVLGVAGALAQFNNGWTERFPGMASVSIESQDKEEQRNTRWQEFRSRGCFLDQTEVWDKERCFLNRGAASNALLWGDSFAASYAHGFFENPRAGFNLLQYTAPQCPPIVGYQAVTRPQCAPFNRQVADIIKRYDITTVIMAAGWTEYIKRKKMREEDIGDTEAYLRGLGVRVVVVGQGPAFPFVYPDEYFYSVYGARQDRRDYYAPLDLDPGMNRRISKSGKGSVFFDPLLTFCRESECVFKRGNLYLFSDYGHYTHYGSRLAVDALLDTMN